MGFAIICGCGHSGTTLLVNMFAAHPQVYVPLKETYIFNRRSARVRAWLMRVEGWLRGKTMVIEKTPRHIQVLPKVRRAAPGCKIILMVRDGRDVVASLYKRFGDIDSGVDRWVKANQIVRAEESGSDIAVIRYEDLVQQPEAELRRLCEFLGLPYSPAMMAYHEKKRMWFGTKELKKGTGKDGEEHNNLRNWQVNQPIFDGRGKWKSVFDDVPPQLTSGPARELMDHFGYSVGND